MKNALIIALAVLCLAASLSAQVAVAPLNSPHYQFFSSAGVPLAGGFVYTYAANSTTPVATYSDATGTTLNANPVQLDAGGFATIFLKTIAYKICVQDAAHVQQWCVDNIRSLAILGKPFESGLLSVRPTTCSASVEFYVQTDSPYTLFQCNSSGTGWNTVAATWIPLNIGTPGQLPVVNYAGTLVLFQSPNTVDVRTYHALCDGTTDDLAAFNAAIAALGTATALKGGTISVPAGVCRLSGPLHIQRQMVLQGQGGWGDYAATALAFDLGQSGIVFDYCPTAPCTNGQGDWSVVRDLAIWQGGNVVMTANPNTSTSLTGVNTHGFSGSPAIGDAIYGIDIPWGTTITNIVGNVYTISQSATGTTTGSRFYIAGKAANSSSCTLNSSTTAASCTNPTIWATGDYVFSDSVPVDTFITAISGTTLTLSQAATANGTKTLFRAVDGVKMNSRARLENVNIVAFPNHNVNITASTSFSPSSNANNFQLLGGRYINSGRDCVHVEGADANAGFVKGVDCTSAGHDGFVDKSFLGNLYSSNHAAGAGIVDSSGVPFRSPNSAPVNVYQGNYSETGSGNITLAGNSTWFGGFPGDGFTLTQNTFAFKGNDLYGFIKSINTKSSTTGVDDAEFVIGDLSGLKGAVLAFARDSASDDIFRLQVDSAGNCGTGWWSLTLSNGANSAPLCIPDSRAAEKGVGFPKGINTTVAENSDLAGQLTLSGGTKTYTFAGTYTSAPICVATDVTALNPVQVSVSGAVPPVLTVNGTGTDVVNYICVGRN